MLNDADKIRCAQQLAEFASGRPDPIRAVADQARVLGQQCGWSMSELLQVQLAALHILDRAPVNESKP